ncbi:serine threonine phosphatase [Trichoderma arundinaceum]|uniref:Serine threonine phosphatase n=1 Tax=Trichoderma arundinaceum TaxID=490622 RepID=A0A395NPL1_TRIAR|nr:serine threonine phosphatase [Trichoderma arundinaceum]
MLEPASTAKTCGEFLLFLARDETRRDGTQRGLSHISTPAGSRKEGKGKKQEICRGVTKEKRRYGDDGAAAGRTSRTSLVWLGAPTRLVRPQAIGLALLLCRLHPPPAEFSLHDTNQPINLLTTVNKSAPAIRAAGPPASLRESVCACLVVSCLCDTSKRLHCCTDNETAAATYLASKNRPPPFRLPKILVRLVSANPCGDRHGDIQIHLRRLAFPRARLLDPAFEPRQLARHPPAASSFDPQATLVVLQPPFGFPHASVPDLEILSLPRPSSGPLRKLHPGTRRRQSCFVLVLAGYIPTHRRNSVSPLIQHRRRVLPLLFRWRSSIPFTAWREPIAASTAACLILSSARDSKVRKTIIRMDPDCAICHAPASMACDCEAKGLEVAVKQAEERMMRSIYSDIRSWVRAHAQDYILEYFRQLAERRKTAHSAHLDHITAHAFYHYNAPPHPNQIAEAQATLKRGIDEDWQASVQRYPEVLEYFYSLIELTLPADDEAAVKNPPLTAPPRKPSRRAGSISASAGSAPPPAIAPPSSFHDREALMERRTPAPPAASRDRRTFRPPPPSHHPSASYYAPFG